MLLTEQKVRKVIRHTIRQNNYRINERFYSDLNKNLMQEGVISVIKDFSKKHGVGIIRSLALIAALGALAPSSQTSQFDTAIRKTASQMLQRSEDFRGDNNIDNMASVQDIADGKMNSKEALALLRSIKNENEAEGLVDAAANLGTEIDETITDVLEPGSFGDIVATAIDTNSSFEDAQLKVDLENL